MKTSNIQSIDEFKKNIGIKSRLLGIDPGKKNIGIAICDENKAVATPFKTLIKKKFESLLREIDKIIQENEIKGIVIGKAINMNGSLGRSAQSSMDFAKNLSKNVTIPIDYFTFFVNQEPIKLAYIKSRFADFLTILVKSQKMIV